MKIGLLSGLLSFVVISAISIAISGILSFTGLDPTERLISTLTVFSICLIIITIYRERIKKHYVTWGLNWILNALDDQFGVKKIYNNFVEAQEDMKQDFRSSKEVYLFFQLGRADIGGQVSLLFDETMSRKEQDFNMQVLFADGNSRFLTRARADDRGSNYREWQTSQNYVEGSIEALKDVGIKITARRHSEPYLWRLFFFGDTLYFMPYLYKRHNHKKAPVFKISSNGKDDGVIFRTLMRYFDDIWEKSPSNESCHKSGALETSESSLPPSSAADF